MITMFDTVTVSTVPDNPQAVAGYVAGNWPTYDPLVAKFPKAYHLSIAVQASQRARCLDIEDRDATPDQAPGWFRNLADRSHGKPVLYTSASMVNTVVGVMTRAGIPRDQYFIWSAHYTMREHICSPKSCGFPRADATQWSDRALGRNLDQSLCEDYFFSAAPPKTEDLVALTSFVTEAGVTHVVYEHKDGSLWYTWQRPGENAWHGGKEGQSPAGLVPFAPNPRT